MALIGHFNANDVPPQQDYSPIPTGEYVAQIIDSDMKPTKRGDGQYLELTYEILEGDQKGRLVWVRLNLDNPNAKAVEIAQRQLSSICHAVDTLNVTDSQQLHYKPHVIRVEYVKADGVKTQNDTNEVKAWKKLDRAPAMAAPPATAAAQAAAPTPPWVRK